VLGEDDAIDACIEPGRRSLPHSGWFRKAGMIGADHNTRRSPGSADLISGDRDDRSRGKAELEFFKQGRRSEGFHAYRTAGFPNVFCPAER
jgi:hypothetical protein